MRGFLAGALVLIVVETLGRRGASGRAAGLLQGAAGVVEHVVSPKVAGLRNFAAATSSSSAAARSNVSRLPSAGARQQAVRAG